MLQRSGALTPGHEVGWRDHVSTGAPASRFPHGDNPIGLTVRQRFEQNGAHDAKDRRGRADAESEREQCRSGKAGCPPKHTGTVPNIPNRFFELLLQHIARYFDGGRA
jgi:hypothetical protein